MVMTNDEDEQREMVRSRAVGEYTTLWGVVPDLATARLEHEDPSVVDDFIQNVCEVFEVEDPPDGWPTLLSAFIERLHHDWDKETYAEFLVAADEVHEPAPRELEPAPGTASGEFLQETCSGGGPVIVVPSDLAAAWRGTLPPANADVPADWTWGDGGVTCDYDRACDEVRDAIRTDYGGVGWLPVGTGRAIILDTELVTAILPNDDGLVLLRNYVDPPTRDMAERLLDGISADDWVALAEHIEIASGRLYAFDSAFEGASDAEEILADDGVAVGELAPGSYRVDVATRDGLDVIRLRRT